MSLSEVMVCPKLEELILVLGSYEGTFDLASIVGMKAARALRGAKLGTVRIVNGDGRAGLDVSELRKHVLYVEYRPGLVQSKTVSSDKEDLEMEASFDLTHNSPQSFGSLNIV